MTTLLRLIAMLTLLVPTTSCNLEDLRAVLGPDFELTDATGRPVRGPEALVRGRAVGTTEEALFVSVAGEFTAEEPLELQIEPGTRFLADGNSYSQEEFFALLRAGDPIEARGNIQSARSGLARIIELKRNAPGFREGVELLP
ncbi:MAG: hypothetical protein NDJ90_09470 [Oligoflexia bacterium]|nr:hypothetical protein [Oligoflexia bacterium]